MILKIPCPRPGCTGYMAQVVGNLTPDGQTRRFFTVDVTDPKAIVVCSNCGHEAPLPQQAQMMLA